MIEKQRQKLDRLSDRQLVDLLLANDEEAVEYVFFHRCDNLFLRLVTDFNLPEGAKKEELINEFYLFLSTDDWRRLRQFKFRSSLNSWLAVVAIRFFRSKNSFFQTNTVEIDSLIDKDISNTSGDADILDDLSKRELYEAIERLPKPRERFALLGMLSGKNAETIAEEMGCTVTAVYNLTKRAKLALKKRMKGNDYEK